jgi:2-hydroxy-3-oxopropionate reductase
MSRVGFVGLGVMGAPMAHNLAAAGFDLIVYNRSSDATMPLVASGARRAAQLADAADADVVITMLSNDAAVREVILGANGLLAAIAPGSSLIDMSTVTPALARELAGAARERGVAFLDAPVSGGDVGARDGTLSIMVGGEAQELDRVRDVLEALGTTITHVGPSGAGQATKAANQLLVAVIIAGISEALTLGTRLGVAPDVLLDVLSRGSAANRMMEVKRSNLLDHTFVPGFKVDLHHKDLGIVLSSAAAQQLPLPITAFVQGMFDELRAAGAGAQDHSALLTVVEARIAGPRVSPG